MVHFVGVVAGKVEENCLCSSLTVGVFRIDTMHSRFAPPLVESISDPKGASSPSTRGLDCQKVSISPVVFARDKCIPSFFALYISCSIIVSPCSLSPKRQETARAGGRIGTHPEPHASAHGSGSVAIDTRSTGDGRLVEVHGGQIRVVVGARGVVSNCTGRGNRGWRSVNNEFTGPGKSVVGGQNTH